MKLVTIKKNFKHTKKKEKRIINISLLDLTMKSFVSSIFGKLLNINYRHRNKIPVIISVCISKFKILFYIIITASSLLTKLIIVP